MDQVERNTPQRNRKPPNRYGVSSNDSYMCDPDEENEDDLLALYGDDSMEDKNYSPETPKRSSAKVVATIRKVNTKRVHFADKQESDKIPITGINFDGMYDDLLENITIVSDPGSSREKNELNASLTNQGYYNKL